MRADRLLSALLLLQAHGRLTGRELARRLEVSGRTVHRDMEALSAAGVPVFALRGAHGGWQLDNGWRTQVPGLDEAELRALLMSQPRMIGDTRLAGAAERAIGKLLASLPVTLRQQAASIRQRLYVDTTGWRGVSENLVMLPMVQEAVSRDRKLKIHYQRPGTEAVERIVDPLGLVAKGSTWYLVANTGEVTAPTVCRASLRRPSSMSPACGRLTSTSLPTGNLRRSDSAGRFPGTTRSCGPSRAPQGG
jgi:predicted DNA-binding transcriptional regulator YafY